jgi:hypothetical protein
MLEETSTVYIRNAACYGHRYPVECGFGGEVLCISHVHAPERKVSSLLQRPFLFCIPSSLFEQRSLRAPKKPAQGGD